MGSKPAVYCCNCGQRLLDEEIDIKLCNECVEFVASVSEEHDGKLYTECQVCKKSKDVFDFQVIDPVKGRVCKDCYSHQSCHICEHYGVGCLAKGVDKDTGCEWFKRHVVG